MNKFNVTLHGYLYRNCYFLEGMYLNGTKALSLMGDCGGGYDEPITNVTVNFPEERLDNDTIILNDQNGESGLLESLLDAGLLGKVVGWKKSGFCSYPIVKLVS